MKPFTDKNAKQRPDAGKLAAGLTPLAGGRKAELRRQYRSFSVSLCLSGSLKAES
jgi:hypothetical protein